MTQNTYRFSYHCKSNINGSETKFSDMLQTRPCLFEGCSRQGHAYEMCNKHLKSELNLEIKKSDLVNAGLGLFAIDTKSKNSVVFKKDSIICYIIGEKLNSKQVVARYGRKTKPWKKIKKEWLSLYSPLELEKIKKLSAAKRKNRQHTGPYLLPARQIGKNKISLDGALMRGCAHFANHLEKPLSNAELQDFEVLKDRMKKFTYKTHPIFPELGLCLEVRATKDIFNGEEIYINYGTQYELNEKGCVHSTKKMKKRKYLEDEEDFFTHFVYKNSIL